MNFGKFLRALFYRMRTVAASEARLKSKSLALLVLFWEIVQECLPVRILTDALSCELLFSNKMC